MSTLRHYRGDTATYTFDHTLDMGDITKVSLYVRDTIDGTLRVATNSDDHAAAWVIGADSITLTLDEPGGPAAATTTSVALTKYHTQFVYDVQVETAAETVTPPPPTPLRRWRRLTPTMTRPRWTPCCSATRSRRTRTPSRT
jgi:hypothetical protein